MLDRRGVDLALEDGLHTHCLDGHALIHQAVDQVVIRLRVRQRERREHGRLARAEQRRRVRLLRPPVCVEEEALAAPVDPVAPVQRALPHLIQLDLATEVREVARDALVQPLLEVLARELVRPVLVVVVAAVEERGRDAAPVLRAAPRDHVVDGLLPRRYVARRGLVVGPQHLLLDSARPKVARRRAQVPEVVGGSHRRHGARLDIDAEGEEVAAELHVSGAIVDRPVVGVVEGEAELTHAPAADALGRALQPGHAVLDLDLLVLELVEVVDARVLADVEVRPDRVADVLRLEVDDDVVHLPVGVWDGDGLGADLLVVLVKVEEGDGHSRHGIGCMHLLDARPEGKV